MNEWKWVMLNKSCLNLHLNIIFNSSSTPKKVNLGQFISQGSPFRRSASKRGQKSWHESFYDTEPNSWNYSTSADHSHIIGVAMLVLRIWSLSLFAQPKHPHIWKNIACNLMTSMYHTGKFGVKWSTYIMNSGPVWHSYCTKWGWPPYDCTRTLAW